MPSPFYILLAPLLLAALLYFLRHWPRIAGFVGAAALLILLLIVARIDLEPSDLVVTGGLIQGSSWEVLGREIALTGAIRSVLLFAYGTLAFVFFLTAILPQGAVFVPLSIAVLSPLAGALMVKPLVFGALLLLIASGFLAMMIQGERAGSTLAAFRYLSMMALAAPLLLVAGWIVETDQTPLMNAVVGLYAVAFIILLAGFPFQIWVAPLVSESQPLVPTMVIGVAQMMIATFCLILLLGTPGIQGSAQFWQVLRLSGITVLILATLFCLTAQSSGKFLGYLILINIGVVIMAFSFQARFGPELIFSILIARVPGLILTGLGFGYLRYQLGSDFSTRNLSTASRGLALISPIGVALLIYGGLTLVGFPLTVGFRGNLMAIELASTHSFWMAALIILAIAAGVAKLLHLLANSLYRDSVDGQIHKNLTREMKWVAAFSLGASLFLAVYPQPLTYLAQKMIQLI